MVAVLEMVGVVEVQPLVVSVEAAALEAPAQMVRLVVRALQVAPTQLSHLVDHPVELSSQHQLPEHRPTSVVAVVEVTQQIFGTLLCAQQVYPVEAQVAAQVLVTEKHSMVQTFKDLREADQGVQTLVVVAVVEPLVTRRKHTDQRYQVR